MREAVIVGAVRTPVGRYGGALKDMRPDDLAAFCIAEIVKRNNLDPNRIEDVVLGCTNQAGEDNRNVARMALLLAGFPVTVVGRRSMSVWLRTERNQQCGASHQGQ